MVTSFVMSGSALVEIVNVDGHDGSEKSMPAAPAALFACTMAARSEPAVGALLLPLSAVVVTKNVVADAHAGMSIATSANECRGERDGIGVTYSANLTRENAVSRGERTSRSSADLSPGAFADEGGPVVRMVGSTSGTACGERIPHRCRQCIGHIVVRDE